MLAEEFGPITDEELQQATGSAELLEEYLDDTPYPSCLVLGFTRAGRPLHFVVAYDDSPPRVIVVTVYQPDPVQWEDDRRRKL